MSKKKTLVKVRSIKNTFGKDLTPNVGKIVMEQKRPSEHERSMAQLILKDFGGEIVFLAESKEQGISMPDAIWLGVSLEIKEVIGNQSVDNGVKRALTQIGKKGVILLDITKNIKDKDILIEEAIHRVRRDAVNGRLLAKKFQIIFYKRKKLVDILDFVVEDL